MNSGKCIVDLSDVRKYSLGSAAEEDLNNLASAWNRQGYPYCLMACLWDDGKIEFLHKSRWGARLKLCVLTHLYRIKSMYLNVEMSDELIFTTEQTRPRIRMDNREIYVSILSD